MYTRTPLSNNTLQLRKSFWADGLGLNGRIPWHFYSSLQSPQWPRSQKGNLSCPLVTSFIRFPCGRWRQQNPARYVLSHPFFFFPRQHTHHRPATIAARSESQSGLPPHESTLRRSLQSWWWIAHWKRMRRVVAESTFPQVSKIVHGIQCSVDRQATTKESFFFFFLKKRLGFVRLSVSIYWNWSVNGRGGGGGGGGVCALDDRIPRIGCVELRRLNG